MLECGLSTYQHNITAEPPKRMTGNWPSYYGIYTIGGYNLTYEDAHYSAVDSIMTTSEHFSEYSMGNAVNLTEWIDRYEHGEVDIDKWSEQIKNSAIKYILLYYENPCVLTRIKEIINSSNIIYIENVRNMEDGYAVLKLGGVNSLAYDDDGMILKTKDIINGIEVTGKMTGKVHLSFLYEEKYIAYTIKNHQRKYFTISEDESGYMIIDNDNSSQIFVEYKDTWSNVTILFAVLSTLFLFSSIVVQQKIN